MEGISKERLKKIIAGSRGAIPESLLLACHEVQEPWMTLEEFLNSGFEGWCWLINTEREVSITYFESLKFYCNDLGSSEELDSPELNITHVMPIQKPEPPR